MSFFDDSHVMGLQGSAGPPVGTWEMIQQDYRQQWHVDSQRALDEELRTRWVESLQALRAAGQNFGAPVDPLMYRGYARFVREGVPVTTPTVEGSGYGARINYDLQQPHPEFEEIRRADEAIRRLNNPDIRTFQQILDEVGEMQRDVEQETASMSERAPWYANVLGLAGSIVGSFTHRDPLNVVTAPWGAGRHIATRIGSDMAIAAGVVTATEFGDVAPNRALAGLPERSPLLSIGAATLGAGIIRGGIEGIGYGVGRLRGRAAPEEIDFNLRDSQLQQMFENNQASPTARAGAQALDDVTFIERNNPYGEGRAASVRFLAELQEVQRVMDGEPMTAIARVLPPLPFEYIQKAADFEIVREQAPLVYARMEAAQRRVDELNTAIEQRAALRDLGEVPGERTSDESFAETAELMARYEAEALPNESREDFVIRMTREEVALPREGGDIDADAERLFNVRATEQTDLRTWFRDSKIVGARGEPLVVYHGSPFGGLSEVRSAAAVSGVKGANEGIYFTRKEGLANIYSEGGGFDFKLSKFESQSLREPTVYRAILKVENPLVVNAPAGPGPLRAAAAKLVPSLHKKVRKELRDRTVEARRVSASLSAEDIARLKAEGYDGIVNEASDEIVVFDPSQVRLITNEKIVQKAPSRDQLRLANKEYEKAYRAVEAEAARIHEQQARVEATEQRQAANIFAVGLEGRTFTGPLLKHDYVEELVNRINAFNETLDEKAVAAFVREAESESKEGVSAPIRAFHGGRPGKTQLISHAEREGIDDGNLGIYGTPHKEYAQAVGKQIYEVEFDINNPLRVDNDDPQISWITKEDAERLEEQGYDAIINDDEIVVWDKSKVRIVSPSYFTEDGRIDIGLTESVDPEFRILTEEGNEISVAEAMRDLQDDADLDDSMRTCLT